MNPPPPAAAGSPGSDVARALAAMAAETSACRQSDGGTVSDTLAGWLATRYVLAASRLMGHAGDAGIDLETLSSLSADVVALRKGDHGAERLRIEREKLELERERGEKRMLARFEEWLKEPGITERILGPKLTPEEKEARLREIFGLGKQVSRGLSPQAIEQIEKAIRIL